MDKVLESVKVSKKATQLRESKEAASLESEKMSTLIPKNLSLLNALLEMSKSSNKFSIS
jgi:hypothetical protein